MIPVMLASELPIEETPQDEFDVATNALFSNGCISVNSYRICTSCGVHGFILMAHMNEHTLNNVMKQ